MLVNQKMLVNIRYHVHGIHGAYKIKHINLSKWPRPHCDLTGRMVHVRGIIAMWSYFTGWWFGTCFFSPIYWECHHPNFSELQSFSEGLKPTTNQFSCVMVSELFILYVRPGRSSIDSTTDPVQNQEKHTKNGENQRTKKMGEHAKPMAETDDSSDVLGL